MTNIETFSRIRAVERIASDLYWQREPNATTLRDLDTHEALFLSAVNSIQRAADRTRNDACKTWGRDSQAYAALCNLSYREEASKLEAALKSYRAECDRLEWPDDDEAMAQAAE